MLWVANFGFPLYEICVQNQRGHKFLRSSALAAHVRLPLEQNVYLLFYSDIVSSVRKTNEGEKESIILLIVVLWGSFNCCWLCGGGVGQKALFRTSLNRIFLFVAPTKIPDCKRSMW